MNELTDGDFTHHTKSRLNNSNKRGSYRDNRHTGRVATRSPSGALLVLRNVFDHNPQAVLQD